MITLSGNKVAVVPLFDPDRYGSLYIPEGAKERVDQGIVKYLGPKCEHVKIGDHVIFSGYTGSTIEVEGEGIMIFMPEDFISAVLESPVSDIPGLYFRTANGEYFTATYEQAMRLIAEAFRDQPWFNSIKFNVDGGIRTRPKVEEYDNLR
jgi:co-chaperonin GroES (HSP10)